MKIWIIIYLILLIKLNQIQKSKKQKLIQTLKENNAYQSSKNKNIMKKSPAFRQE